MKKLARFTAVVMATAIAAGTLLAGSLLQACKSAKDGKQDSTKTESGDRKKPPEPVVCDPVIPSPQPEDNSRTGQ